MSVRRHAIVGGFVVCLVAACASAGPGGGPGSGTAGASSVAAPSTSVAPASPAPTASPSPSVGASARPSRADDCNGLAPTHHDAPELEATLPSEVAGRPLARWSVVGMCLLETILNESVDPAEFLREADTTDPARTIDPLHLRYAVAGRSDVSHDPPYFVFAAGRSRSDEEIQVALLLLFGGAGFGDPIGAADLSHYEKRTIAARTVYVGTTDMLAQTEHSRGRPYLYQTDAVLYLVVTDDDQWALDAIKQLP